MAPRAKACIQVARLARPDAQSPCWQDKKHKHMLSRTVAGLMQQLIGSTHCSLQIEQIIAWLKGMPGKQPAPHDQEPLHYAVSQESGMILVAYCCIDKQAVMIKLHHASACMQPRLSKLMCISASIGTQSEMDVRQQARQ